MSDTSLPELNLPGTPDSEGWRRLHPLSPILRGGLFLLVLVGIIIVNLRDQLVRIFFAGETSAGDAGDTGDLADLFAYIVERGFVMFVLLGILAVLLLIVFFSWIGWRFRTYRITTDTVEARSGVIFRQHRRAPLDRVQSVNLQRPLLARMIGLTKLEVLTGGQGGKVELTYLGHHDAKDVREQILQLAAARRAGVRVDIAVDQITASGAASLSGTAYAPAADALTARAQDFADFDVDPEAVAANTLVRVPIGRLLGSIALGWETVIMVLLIVLVLGWSIISTIIGAIGGSAVLLAGGLSVVTVIPMVLVMAALIFAQINKGFNFTLSKGRDSVRVGSGLTATTTDSIPFGRVHAIEAKQPLFWRPFGWWKVRVTLAGHSVTDGGQSASQNLVLPVGPIEDVVKVIETLVPGTSEGIIDGLVGNGEGYIGGGKDSAWVLWFARKRVGVQIHRPETADAAHPESDLTLRIRRGFMTRSLSVMPIVRAQSVQLRRPMVHYWLGLASVQAHTVIGPVSLQVRGLDLDAARLFFDELSATVLRVQRSESDARYPRDSVGSASEAEAGSEVGSEVGPNMQPESVAANDQVGTDEHPAG